MESTKITASVTLAKVTAESVASEKAIKNAIAGDGLMALKVGEAGIRSYGFLASVVILTETKAKDLSENYGADKGRLSKAGKCVRFVLSDIIAPETVTADSCQDAIEYLANQYGSLNDAYSALFPTDPKAMTEEMLVKNFFAGLDKHDLNLQVALGLLIAEAESRQG